MQPSDTAANGGSPSPLATHEVLNQTPPLADFNPWDSDPALRAAVERAGAGWVAPRARTLGAQAGSARMQQLAADANRNPPELRTHDARGMRIDEVAYHPAYHELMALALGHGLHSLAWTETQPAAFSARAALCYLWNQLENGTACPVTMSFAARQVLRQNPALAAQWEAKLFAPDYDPRPLPLAAKRAVTIGMAMTEKQGGSDLRANTTRAVGIDAESYLLTGHKWFCSAPMSDAFLSLAQTARGITCFLVPRFLPDGRRNRFLLQRLKDKCGNRSNASAEVEYQDTWAQRIGEEGRGIATLIEMAHLTRFDIVVASAGMMRAALVRALHHAAHRRAFGRTLREQPLMANVLADLALEWEAALLLAMRLAQAFDRTQDDRQQRFARIVTPVAKYWLCKRNPMVAAEAMECLGGNGYVEESPLARLYREAPVNGIWEGSGNVICLDVLRAVARDPHSLGAVLEEIEAVAAQDAHLARYVVEIEREFASGADLEVRARRLTQRLAIALQASLMLRHASTAAAEAYCASRLRGDAAAGFGTLPPGTGFGAILERAFEA
jgi:putative acyl-CoA dehydrogenase